MVNDKHYDWRQVGPAIREAQAKGLKLTRDQLNELTDVESSAPIQSMPDMFRDWGNILDVMRGSK